MISSDFSAQVQGLENLVQQTVNQFVVKTPGSAGSIGISGFLFDILDREEMAFESDITDSYIEDNSAIQDHIALKPERFTLRGYVGELTDSPDQALQAFLFAGTTIQNVAALLPSFSIQANQTYASVQNLESSAAQALTQGENLYNLFKSGSTSAEKQQNAFQFFYSMWLSRQLCTVETPYRVFQNMAIESVHAVQNGETNTVSEFSVTFKMIRKTATILSAPIAAAINTAASVAQTSWGNYGTNQTNEDWSQPAPAATAGPTASSGYLTSVMRWANLAVNPVAGGVQTAQSIGSDLGDSILNFNKETKQSN